MKLSEIFRRHLPGPFNAALRRILLHAAQQHAAGKYPEDVTLTEALRLSVRQVALTARGRAALAAILADVGPQLGEKAGPR